jgi:DNA-binding PadR family transcriptional regulator
MRSMPTPGEHALSLTEWRVLCLTCESATHGLAVSASLEPHSDLGRIWHAQKAVVDRAIDRLQDLGYIRRIGQAHSILGPAKSLVEATREGRRLARSQPSPSRRAQPDLPFPATSPPAQLPAAPRTCRLSSGQPRSDLGLVIAYREHGRLHKSSGPPGGSGKGRPGGPASSGHAHVVVGHAKRATSSRCPQPRLQQTTLAQRPRS